MDNKITRKRLSDFLAYEWIVVIIVIIASIIAWELAYTIGSVKLTVGQEFKYYYDQNVYSTGEGKLYSLMLDKKALSYDILEFYGESLSSDFNVLSTRLSVQEGDIIITDSKEAEEGQPAQQVRAKSIVDHMSGVSFEKLLKDAKTYLRDNFLQDGLKTVSDYTANPDADLDLAVLYENLDSAKIQAHFLKRMRKDNRYRTDTQKAEGIELEKVRIEKLCTEVQDFEKLILAESTHPDLFFRYTRFEQSLAFAEEQRDKERYEEYLKEQQECIYGLNVSALKDYNTDKGEQKTNPTEYFTLIGSNGKADNIVIMAFDFWDYQYDLQFETISFINTIVRQCSDILD